MATPAIRLCDADESNDAIGTIARCLDADDGFLHWCETCARIEDKDSHRAIPFRLYECQRELADMLVRREWLRILKARRLGFTWLAAAHAVWLATLHRLRTVAYAVHKKEFAADFIDRCRFIFRHLPAFMQPPLTRDSKFVMEFNSRGQGCSIRALAATAGAADSLTADMIIIDEATKIDRRSPGLLRTILHSVEPTVETAHGFIVQIATGDGPQGEFYDGWQRAARGQDKYRNVFYPWTARPGRTPEWHAQEKSDHAGDPLYMARQYPGTAEEAFSAAENRVYPLFAPATHVGRPQPNGGFVIGDDATAAPQWIDPNWPKWRAVDFGAVHPFVCLWIAEVSDCGARLTVDPSCQNTIRELLAYRHRPGSETIDDQNDDCADCLRYAVESFGLRGWLHVYRELYVPNAKSCGYTLDDLAKQIVQLSGDERFRLTVADRSCPSGERAVADLAGPVSAGGRRWVMRAATPQVFVAAPGAPDRK